MPGEGVAKPRCGTVAAVHVCERLPGTAGTPPAGPRQAPLPGAGPVHAHAVLPYWCKSPQCPVCWPAWLARAAARGAERLEAARVLYGHRPARHFTFSPPQADAKARLRAQGAAWLPKTRRRLYALARAAGLRGALVVFHPWRCIGQGKDRYRRSPRYLSPHFHVLAYGHMENSSRFYARTGWIVKNHDARKGRGGRRGDAVPVSPVARLMYLLDHCGIDASDARAKDAVTAFGDVHDLAVVSRSTVCEPISCPCGAPVWEHEPGDDISPWGAPIAPAESVLRVTVYRRARGRGGPPGAPELYYTLLPDHPPPGTVQRELDAGPRLDAGGTP